MREWINLMEGREEQFGDALLRIQGALQKVSHDLDKIGLRELADIVWPITEKLDELYREEEARLDALRAEAERQDRERFGDI